MTSPGMAVTPIAPTTIVHAPITRVLVMEDRAQVERAGELTLEGVDASGIARLVVGELPVAAVDRSLKCEVKGARLVDAKLVRTWRERPKGGLASDASDLRRREHALGEERIERGDSLASLTARREVLGAARADLLRAIAEAAGTGHADQATWSEQLEAVCALEAKNDEAMRLARLELDRVEHLLGEARHAIAVAEEREHDLECRLALTIQVDGAAPGAKVTIRASYLVPCAAWRPAYRATLDRGGASPTPKVQLEAEAVIWQRTGETWSDVELAFSTARPTLGTTPPALYEDRISTRPKAQIEKRVVQVAIREQEIQSAGETSRGGDEELPGLDDGGEARLIAAPGRATVPSDGQPHRVPLFRFEAPAQLDRVCPAELTPLVSLVATFANAGSQVLLAGPVDLIREGGFAGRAQVKFAAPGETLKLSFGSDDGLRVVRAVEERQEEARITGKRTTTRTVKLFVSNASGETAKIAISERVPVSEVKEVTVQVLTKECRPAPVSVSAEGIARLELELPAGHTREARLVWELQATGKVAGV